MTTPPTAPESLLARTAWLRRLARGLLHDPHAAEDAVQDVMVVALRQPAGHVQDWRAWFRRVLRRTIAHQRATDTRRRRRETELATASTIDTPNPTDPSTLVAQAALQRRVVGHLLALDEPYRTTLLLRFWEDLPPRKIAARLGVPVDTVNSRIQRGLSRLRGRLDKERHDWRAALLPFAANSLPFAPWALGVLSMSMQTKLVLGACCALLAAVWWIGSPGAAADPIPADGLTAARPDEVAVRPPGTLRTDPADPPAGGRTHVATGDGPTFVVRGVVQSYTGDPMPRARIEAELFLGYEMQGTPARTHTTTADTAGRFTWDLPVPDQTITLRFRSAAPREWHGYGTRLVVRGQPAPDDVVVRGSLLDLRISGRVLDAQSRPVEAAVVWNPFTQEESASSADGRYELRSWSGVSSARVYCRKAGFVLTNVEVGTAGAQDGGITLDITLNPGWSIPGRVVDAEGRGIAGARLRTGHEFGTQGLTAEDGSFVLASLDPTATRQVVVFTHRDFLEKRVTVRRTAGLETLDVTLDKGARVEGRVFDPAGRPLPGVSVRVRPERGGGVATLSRDDGSFVLENAEPGPMLIEATHPGFCAYKLPLTVPAAGDALRDVVVRLEPEHVLAGRLLSADGTTPVEGGVAAIKDGRYYHDGGRADARGRFRLGGLPAGEVRLEVYGAGHLRRLIDNVGVDQEDLEVVLQRAAGLSGTVLDAESGAPIRAFKVRFVKADRKPGEVSPGSVDAAWFAPGVAYRSQDGRWSTAEHGATDMQPGGVLGIEITAEGYAPFLDRRVVATVDSRPEDLVCELHRAGRIHGRVVVAGSGQPVAGATVRVTSAGRPLELVGEWLEGNAITVQTDADGRFDLGGAPTGSLALRVEHVAHPWSVDGPFVVRPGQVVKRTVQLPEGQTLRGRGPAGAQVLLRAPGSAVCPDLALVTRAGDDGVFEFPQRLGVGEYHVIALAGDGRRVVWTQARAVLRAGVGESVDVRSGDDTRLVGQVPAGSSVARLRPASGGPWFEVPVDGQRFEVRGLPAGEWEVYRVGRVTVERGRVTEAGR